MNPMYQHDCTLCVFLGTVMFREQPVDLYFCPNEPTVIARYSSDGPDYSSGLVFAEHNAALGCALTLAKARGLI